MKVYGDTVAPHAGEMTCTTSHLRSWPYWKIIWFTDKSLKAVFICAKCYHQHSARTNVREVAAAIVLCL